MRPGDSATAGAYGRTTASATRGYGHRWTGATYRGLGRNHVTTLDNSAQSHQFFGTAAFRT